MPHPLAFVFKRELLKIPFFGWSMARLDMIHIDRESRAQAMKHVIEQGCRVLSHGTWVIMFPEGTRMPRGQKGTFQTAGTRLAVQSGAPVVPIAVATARCWPKEGFIKHAGLVTVSIGPAIPSVGRDPKGLMREVEAWIEAELRRIDPEAYRAA
jgi:1-acyl-sn-glycerol-3-phosphate acyltransferase